MTVNNDDAINQIFSRCSLNCLHVPLWRCYIRFIRKVNDKRGMKGQEETRKAFDFMLRYVVASPHNTFPNSNCFSPQQCQTDPKYGADIASSPVWMEYIAFLKSLPAQNAQEESQRMIPAIRKVYQKAIVTPNHHIELLWKN